MVILGTNNLCFFPDIGSKSILLPFLMKTTPPFPGVMFDGVTFPDVEVTEKEAEVAGTFIMRLLAVEAFDEPTAVTMIPEIRQ